MLGVVRGGGSPDEILPEARTSFMNSFSRNGVDTRGEEVDDEEEEEEWYFVCPHHHGHENLPLSPLSLPINKFLPLLFSTKNEPKITKKKREKVQSL